MYTGHNEGKMGCVVAWLPVWSGLQKWDAVTRRQYDDESPKHKDFETDDLPIDPQVCSADVSSTKEYKECTLHFSETELPQVSHLKTSCKFDSLSELVYAIDNPVDHWSRDMRKPTK